ncbi:MAG: protoporphyrinogen oxidase [Sulfobacillus sp.]
MSAPKDRFKVAIVGGGLAGLATTHRLLALAEAAGQSLDVVLFERDRTLGGKVHSQWSEAGVLVERGPDSFLTRKPALLDLIGEIGLSDQLIATNGAALSSAIYCRGRMRRLPAGMGALVPADITAFLRSDLLTVGGRVRALRDLWLRPPPEGDLSLRQVIGQRLGTEYLLHVAEPLMAGIHSADPDQMSVAATMPGLLTFLSQDRSLMRGARRQMRRRPSSAMPPFMSLRDGMGSLIAALDSHLPGIDRRLGSEVESIAKVDRGVEVRAKTTDGRTSQELVDAIVVATPAGAASRLLSAMWPDLAQQLAQIPTHLALTITYAYRRQAIPDPLPGHGWLIPRDQGLTMRGATVMTNKWQDRSRSPDLISIRAFLGGPSQDALQETTDQTLAELVATEMSRLLKVKEAPLEANVERVTEGNPEYRVGHLDRLAQIDRLLDSAPQLAVAGASYRGVGLPDVVRSGQEAASRVWKGLVRSEAKAGP